MHYLIDQRRAEIALLCRRYGVRRLEVFGSAARGADFDPVASDADFLVDFEPGSEMPPLRQLFGLAEDLEALLGRPVDLAERKAVETSRNYIAATISWLKPRRSMADPGGREASLLTRHAVGGAGCNRLRERAGRAGVLAQSAAPERGHPFARNHRRGGKQSVGGVESDTPRNPLARHNRDAESVDSWLCRGAARSCMVCVAEPAWAVDCGIGAADSRST